MANQKLAVPNDVAQIDDDGRIARSLIVLLTMIVRQLNDTETRLTALETKVNG